VGDAFQRTGLRGDEPFPPPFTASTRNPSVSRRSTCRLCIQCWRRSRRRPSIHVGGGRFTLNVVTGWNKSEIELFGSPLLEHAERYEMADEWITLMKQLWTSEEPVDFDGCYYTVKQALLKPRPIQPYPALMNASGSPVGKASPPSISTSSLPGPSKANPASVREQMDAYRNFAFRSSGAT